MNNLSYANISFSISPSSNAEGIDTVCLKNSTLTQLFALLGLWNLTHSLILLFRLASMFSSSDNGRPLTPDIHFWTNVSYSWNDIRSKAFQKNSLYWSSIIQFSRKFLKLFKPLWFPMIDSLRDLSEKYFSRSDLRTDYTPLAIFSALKCQSLSYVSCSD